MKLSNKSEKIIKSGVKTVVNNFIICSLILIVLGVVTFLCAFNIYPKTGYVYLVNVIALISVLIGIILICSGIVASLKKKKELKSFIEDFSFCVEGVTKAAVMNYHDPIVVVSENGSIQWYNNEFSAMAGIENLFEVKLQNILPAIRLSDFLSDKKSVQAVSYNGKDYMITGEAMVLDEHKASVIAVMFSDISEITRLQTEIDEKQSIVCNIIIDNYDEVLKETPNSNHSVLLGDVERCISLWVDRGEGFYRKYERDKYIILFENAKFDALLAEKFSILNDIKEIDQQNKIPVTISIGVGMDASDIRENDRLSLSALEMALGRGGDQAVVKSDEGYSFYGAKSLGVEKTTKVKARVVAKSLCALIDKASNVVIMGHKGSDFDSFGSAVGLFRTVVNRNKKAYIALDRNHNNIGTLFNEVLIQSEYNEGIISQDRALSLVNDKTLLIIVDTHRPVMVEYPELLNRTENIVLIDHHRRSEEFIENLKLTYHEPYASSASEMVTEVLQYMDDEKGLSLLEAEVLYCGIYLDTKGFTFKTGARTFEAAAYLRKMGVDPVRVHKLFRNDISMYIQKSRAISQTKIYQDNIAIAVFDEPAKNLQLVVAQTADDLLDISGIEASFVLANNGNRVIISGRSLGSINVQVILEKLGGGGHSTIAGAQLENSSISIAELKLKNAIDDVLFE